MDRLILPRWAIEKLRVLGTDPFPRMKFQAETGPDPENLGLLHGLKVTERTSWGLSDTVVLRGPASVDEDGRPTGPDELEIKISSPTRMGLGEWFKDEELYTLEFGPQSEDSPAGGARQMASSGLIVIPAMTVVERTLWGLSMTCRLQVDAGRGKNIEVKLSLPWPEDRFLKEGQLYSVIFEPVVKEEKPEEVEPGEDEQPYRQEDWSPPAWQVPSLTLRHLDEAPKMDLDRLGAALKFAGPMFQTGWFDGRSPWEADDPARGREATFARLLWNYTEDDDANDN